MKSQLKLKDDQSAFLELLLTHHLWRRFELVVQLMSIRVCTILNYCLADLVAPFEINSSRRWPLIVLLMPHSRYRRCKNLLIIQAKIADAIDVIHQGGRDVAVVAYDVVSGHNGAVVAHHVVCGQNIAMTAHDGAVYVVVVVAQDVAVATYYVIVTAHYVVGTHDVGGHEIIHGSRRVLKNLLRALGSNINVVNAWRRANHNRVVLNLISADGQRR